VVTSNPFAALSAILPPLFMQRYFVLMIVAVAPGTLVGRPASGQYKNLILES
jgi:hypothetical protein